MKKLVICLLVGVLGVTSVAALSLQELERAVFHQVAGQTAKKSIPELSPEQLRNLAKRLPDAAYVMRNDEIEALDPAELGFALEFSVARAMELSKEERMGKFPVVLSNEEHRAVYYALHKLLPKNYLKDVPTFEEYSQSYPVADWTAFNVAAQEAQELVYRAVLAIAEQQDNYRAFWLHSLTH